MPGMFNRRVVNGLLVGSLATAALASWHVGDLPLPPQLRPEVLADPVQVPDEQPPLRTNVEGVDYAIVPRYTYDISGVVVSLHHSDSWWDTAHAEWSDHINLMDVCLAWGDNVAKGTYRDVHFSNSQWECRFETHSSATWAAFRLDQVSNNHLLTADAGLARTLAAIHVGDQIRLRGHLVNYTIYRDGAAMGTRVSSDTRTDTGPGACEVIYLDSAQILASGTRGWRTMRMVALAVLLGAAILWLMLPANFAASDR